jgi:predicted NUDIX family NTP pyrophosphohydrolase
MKKRSAGILMYRHDGDGLRLLLVHPGGPFWKNKDANAWSIPKGEYGAGEDPLGVARREFGEELGADIIGPVTPLGELVQASGKAVVAWAAEGDFDATTLRSNTFEMEWPPRSGRRQSFPEVDRAGWFTPAEAREKLLASQQPFIDRLLEAIGGPRRSARA